MGVLQFGAAWHFTPMASAFLSPWLLLPIPPHCMRALSSATSRDFWQLSTWQGEKGSTDSPISASQGCAGLFAKKGQQRDVGRGWHCMLVALKTAALQMPFTLWGVQGGSCTPFTWDTMKCKGLPALPQHPGTVMLPPPSHYPAHLAAFLPTHCSPCKQAEGETEAALGGHGVSLQQSRLPISVVAS